MVKGKLTLKRELAAKAIVPPVGELTVAHVWVDASVFHLDSTYSYLIPGNLAEKVEIGSLLSVPFHGREVIAVVRSITPPDSLSGLKSISKVIGGFPLFTTEMLALIEEASIRYAAHPFDLIRSAAPDRVATVDKEFSSYTDDYQVSSGKASREYFQLPPYRDRSDLMAKKIGDCAQDGGVLAVLPDSSEVQRLSEVLTSLHVDHVILDSSLPKSELYGNFLKARLGEVRVVIGTRSAIFAPVSRLRTVLIYNEGSEHLYERRSPGWNVRDIALLRSRHQDFQLLFVGYSPSAEISRLIDEKWVEYRRTRSKVKVNVFTQEHGELLPSRALSLVKKALATGPVLFVVPLKGYAQAIRCGQCRTVSRCSCGGAYEKLTANSPITCNHCLTKAIEWRCVWCHSEKISLQSRGAERHQHELGALLPGVKVLISTADHRIDSVIDTGAVIATPGMAPRTPNGYSAIVFLEGNRFLNQPDMRANERVREMFFSHSALASANGCAIFIQDEGNLVTTAVTTWNPSIAIHRELEERQSLGLPPYVRAVKLTMDATEITRLQSALSGARSDGRIPSATKILGPITTGDKASLILTVDLLSGDELISTIHEFIRRRSASKKTLPSLRIDPYSLSH